MMPSPVAVLLFVAIIIAFCDAWSPRKFVVFGGTGRTGKYVVKKLIDLVQSEGVEKITCPVRSLAKGRRDFGPESRSVSLVPCNLVSDRVAKLREIVSGSDAVIICSGYSVLKKGLPDLSGAYRIDNIANKRIIDACAQEGVRKVVLVSSVLSNGWGAGQLLNPQYLLLNAFGGVLIQKRQAELYLQEQYSSNGDYTIVRPGGLKDSSAKKNEGSVPLASEEPILYGAADTLFGGSVSREQVAEVAVASCFLPEAKNLIVEIIASKDARPVTYREGFLSVR
jgi:nucleoside-diphosphate-sugar epimerase